METKEVSIEEAAALKRSLSKDIAQQIKRIFPERVRNFITWTSQPDIFGDIRKHCLPRDIHHLSSKDKSVVKKRTVRYIVWPVRIEELETFRNHASIGNLIEDDYGVLFQAVAEYDPRMASLLEENDIIMVVDEYRLWDHAVARKFIRYYSGNTKI